MIDNAPPIHPGTILHGPQLPEPVEIKLILIRFLIAGDPGAGKTIMVGLIIKEMKIRKQAHKMNAYCNGEKNRRTGAN